ncbi:hypothetical protein GFY24_08725 [Nocardia sp. SYP-A9097]|uniref:hypothetical protein n=1 Tax=Nocardia sp. SYP-A9097 TaxID=2663237 RepID=UPI00129ADDA0|nr:hypothetical protein [Nocardia sp. SYP-A9097]MRH87538.1 hypothetical protein [Nocardia sp. SYP-A9097]
MGRIAVKTISILAAVLGMVFSAAACSTGPSSSQATRTTTPPSATPPYNPYVDQARIVADYAKIDPGIFEKFNTYPNDTAGETRKFFDSNGQPDMDVINHNMVTFDEAKFALIPHDFYQREWDEKYAVHESSVAATHPPK